ncbi:TPA: phage head-tail connector protein [Streptococcus suis]
MSELNEQLILSNVKDDLDISDTLQDRVLLRLIRKVVDHFKLEYRVSSVSEKYNFIIEDCVIKRYNRRRAEGASSMSIEGYSLTFEDKMEFEPYHEALMEDLGSNRVKVRPGRWMIL